MYNYSAIWKILRKFTRSSSLGKLVARLSRLVEHASREFPGVDEFDLNGELGLLRSLSRDWNENSVIFDVGANRGDWAAMALSMKSDRVQIRVFEPDSRLLGFLSNRFAFEDSVIVESRALGSTAGEFDLYLRPLGQDAMNSFTNPSVSGRGSSSPLGLGPLTVKATVTTGDSYLATSGITNVQLLKIDTEGFEMEVLRGFEGSLRKGRIEFIQFEYNFAAARAKLNLEHFLDFLEPLGYKVAKLSYSGLDFAYQLQWNNYDSAPNFVAARGDLIAGVSRNFLSVSDT